MSESGNPEDVTVGVEAAEVAVFFEVANVRAREPMTPQHLWAALHFTRLCSDREADLVQTGRCTPDLSHRSYCMAAVKFSTSFLESLVNDLLSDASDPYMSANGRMQALAPQAISRLAAAWHDTEIARSKRLGILGKYQLALECVEAMQFDSNDSLYEAAFDLLYLRNQLVHFKLDWQIVGAKQNEASPIERRLRTEFKPNQQAIGEPWFPNKCLGFGCAEWACNTATAFANEWLSRLGLPRDYEQVVQQMTHDLGEP